MDVRNFGPHSPKTTPQVSGPSSPLPLHLHRRRAPPPPRRRRSSETRYPLSSPNPDFLLVSIRSSTAHFFFPILFRFFALVLIRLCFVPAFTAAPPVADVVLPELLRPLHPPISHRNRSLPSPHPPFFFFLPMRIRYSTRHICFCFVMDVHIAAVCLFVVVVVWCFWFYCDVLFYFAMWCGLVLLDRLELMV